VHGLNGDARQTWKDRTTGKLWLQDFLPNAIPDSRIMTFGYDSAFVFGSSMAGLDDFALDLLDRIRATRQSEVLACNLLCSRYPDNFQAKNRPLVFICHSLGGIVVKKVRF
jgi:hypothetical protein